MEAALKRSLECDSQIEIKRAKFEYRYILDFSDCVLLKILSYLKAYDLYCLSKTCLRFKYLITDRKLWKKLDVLDHPMCAKKFKFFFENVNKSTDTIVVSGISKKEKTLTFSQFLKINKLCENLTILAIEHQYINSDEIGLKEFPISLKELSLRGTHIYGRQPFLQDAHLKLKKLHTLILADCKWFQEHSLMALSKLKSLENLSLYKCANLNDSVAYMSITAKFGFRRLLRIDARRTSIGDQFLKCFHCIKTLREIYLEAPERPRRRRDRSRGINPVHRSLLDEIQRLYDDYDPRIATNEPQNPVQHVVGANGASAVVFSGNHMFRMRRDRLNKCKKQKKTIVSTHNSTGNCLENCENCCLETCSFIQFQSQSQVFDLRSLSANHSNESGKPVISYVASKPSPDDSRTRKEKIGAENVQSSRDNPASSSSDLETESFRSSSPDEMLYCDDVSDTEDEEDVLQQWPGPRVARNLPTALLELEMLQADVTDSGVQWFMGATQDSEDPVGERSVLFQSPYRPRCSCTNDIINKNDGAGPSGYKPPSSHNRQNINPPLHFQITQKNNGNDGGSSSDSETEATSPSYLPPPSPPRLHSRVLIQNPLQGNARRRDLRVIIERLDPGVHIVYDQRGAARDYTTRLKVFVARGYKHITNQALRCLSDLRVELLDLTGTSVTPKGIKEFLLVNPDCRIIHESTCQCVYKTDGF